MTKLVLGPHVHTRGLHVHICTYVRLVKRYSYFCFLADSTPPVLSDESPAPTTSFLSQECNATVKYSASGKYKDLVPNSVYHLYPSAKKMLKSGFFAVEVIPKVLEKESAVTKVQFSVE